MKTRYIAVVAIVGGALAMGTACSKKKSKASTSTETTALAPGEDTIVTVATGQLQLASAVTILPAKGSAAALRLDGKQAYKLTVEGRTLNLRVSNEAFKTIEQAGSIMCYFGQTKFWEQANEGVYKALVDQAQCEHKSDGGGGGQGGGGGGGDSSKSQELMQMYSKSTREEGKPLIGEFRIPEGDNVIQARVIVVAPPSDEIPSGIFSMAYTFYDANGVAGQFGFIRTKRTDTGSFVLETASNEAGDGRTGTSSGIAELTKDADTGDFTGYVRSESNQTEGTNSNSSAYKVRFDSSYLNVAGSSKSNWGGQERTEVGDGCYDRNKFKTGIYRYDLTNAAGETVKLNSGFPAEFEKDGKIYPANASYYGMWTGEQTLDNGATIYKVEWTDGQKVRTPYTLFKAAGKLIKLTKATTTLKALTGVDLNMYDSGSSYIVKWNGTKLIKVSKVNYTDKGMTEEAATGDVTIPEWGLNLYVSSLNANVNISKNVTLSDTTVISYHSESTVSGTSDLPTGELVCFQNCPKMAPSAAAFKRNEGSMNGPMSSALYETTTSNWGDQSYTSNQASNISSALATYTFNSTTQLLTKDGVGFALPSDLPTGQEEQQRLDQVFSGALIPASAWAAITDKSIDPFRAEQQLEVYYKWTAGASSWAQFQTLKAADSSYVKFDRPIEVNYTLLAADEFDGLTDTNIIGKNYRLTYGGPGQFWGIPWKYNATVGHEMPLFNLKAGTKVGDYLVYPIEGDQRMAATDAANCAGLSLDDLPELPALENSSVKVPEFGDDSSPVRYIAGVATE